MTDLMIDWVLVNAGCFLGFVLCSILTANKYGGDER